MVISMIVCMDPSGLVGKGDALPWNVPEDMAWFKEKTRHKAIVMGRKTFEGIGRALPGRLNIMLTKSGSSTVEGVEDFNDLRAAIRSAVARGYEEVVICGGPETYRYALDKGLVDKIYLTVLNERYEGDKYFRHALLDDLRIALSDGVTKMRQGWVVEHAHTTAVATYQIFARVRSAKSTLKLNHP